MSKRAYETFVAAVALCAIPLSPALAETTLTPVLTIPIQGMPNTEAKILMFDVDPGWKTDHHIHPGHLFVYILEGSLQLDVDGSDPVVYSVGEAFYELPDLGMVGSNFSTSDRAKFVVFQFGEAGKPLMIAQ